MPAKKATSSKVSVESRSKNTNLTEKIHLSKILKNKFIIIVTALVLLFVIAMTINQISFAVHNKQAEEYLEKKYNKQFVVSQNPRPSSALGDKPAYYGIAHEASNPDSIFYITRPASLFDFTQQFDDTYLGIGWAHYQDAPTRDFLSSIFNPVPYFKAEIHPSSNIRKLYDGNVSKADLMDAEMKYGDEIQSSLAIKVYNKSPNDEFDKLLKIALYVKKEYPGSSSVRYVIQIGDTKNQTNRFVCNISSKDLPNITSVDQLSGCFVSMKGWE